MSFISDVCESKLITSNKKTFSGFNVVIDNYIDYNKEVEAKLKKINSEKTREVIKRIKNREDTEVAVVDKKEYNLISRTLKPFIRFKKHGGNAYHSYLLLDKISDAYLFIPSNIRNNFVIEYGKGENKNRIIISQRTHEVQLYSDKTYNADYYFLSGYHHIMTSEMLKKASSYIQKLKGFKHIELSKFSVDTFKKDVIKRILYRSNSIGMNTFELRSIFGLDYQDYDKVSEYFKDYKGMLFVHERGNSYVYVPKKRWKDSYEKIIYMSYCFSQKIAYIKTHYGMENLQINFNNFNECVLEIRADSSLVRLEELDNHYVMILPSLRFEVKKNITGLGDTISTAFSFTFFLNSDF